MTVAGEREIAIGSGGIRLGQLLKLAGVVGSGGEARALLADPAAPVTVNGEPETRRGRQLQDGDLVSVQDATLRVRAARA